MSFFTAETLTMKHVTPVLVFIAGVTTICNSHAASFASPHIMGGTPWKYKTRPEVFDINLYKDKQFIRTCKASELAAIDGFRVWLTAAECLDIKKYDHIEVKFFLHGRFDELKFKLGEVVSYYIHPQYNKATGEHNIGLIKPYLNYVDKDKALRRIQLPTSGENFVDREGNVFLEYKMMDLDTDGYERPTYEVQAIQTLIIDPKWCKGSYTSSLMKSKIACISGLYDKGLSKNDVGIPLVHREDDDTFKLVGIATEVRHWTHKSGSPIGFLDIGPYVDWIQSTQIVEHLRIKYKAHNYDLR